MLPAQRYRGGSSPVSGLRAPPRGTRDTVDTCGRPGYAARDRARGGAPGALHSKSGLCEPERTPAAYPRSHRVRVVTPMVRVLVRRSPVNPVRSEEAAVSGQLRVPRGCLAGATTPATGGRGGTMRAHGHFLPVVTPPRPSRTRSPPASRRRVQLGRPARRTTPHRAGHLMSLSSPPPQDAPSPLCAVCHRPLTSGPDPAGPLT